ncbi:MAG: hypothetical protein IT336_15110 [Thermomicrobiales bacterium]|nr:hypothetical protein [Thermomicrobiales bacterium]
MAKEKRRDQRIDRMPTSVKLFTHSNGHIDRIAEASGKRRAVIIRELVAEALTARRLNQLKRTVRKVTKRTKWQLSDPLTIEQVESVPDDAQTLADEILEELRTARIAATYAAELAHFTSAAMWRLVYQTDDYKDRSLEQFQEIQKRIMRESWESVQAEIEDLLERDEESEKSG